jgi:hypothetical protein
MKWANDIRCAALQHHPCPPHESSRECRRSGPSAPASIAGVTVVVCRRPIVRAQSARQRWPRARRQWQSIDRM